MKNLRLIPIILLTTFLVGCANAGKAPTFSSEGVEVDYEDFNDQLQVASSESELVMLTTPLQDRGSKSYRYASTISSQKRNGKEVYRAESITIEEIDAQYDFDNLVSKEEKQGKMIMKGFDSSNNATYETTSKQTHYRQFETIKFRDTFVNINANSKIYSSLGQSSDKETLFNSYIISDAQVCLNYFYDYKPASIYDADNYLFYVNDETLFTFEMSQDKNQDLMVGTAKYGTKSIRTNIKCQLDLTDKKQALRVKYEVTTQNNYEKDYITGENSSYFAGDVVTVEERVYIDYSLTSKKINLNPVDLSDYKMR